MSSTVHALFQMIRLSAVSPPAKGVCKRHLRHFSHLKTVQYSRAHAALVVQKNKMLVEMRKRLCGRRNRISAGYRTGALHIQPNQKKTRMMNAYRVNKKKKKSLKQNEKTG